MLLTELAWVLLCERLSILLGAPSAVYRLDLLLSWVTAESPFQGGLCPHCPWVSPHILAPLLFGACWILCLHIHLPPPAQGPQGECAHSF